MEGVNIIKIKNNLTSNLQNLVLNFIYYDMIVGEIIIRIGTRPYNYYSNRFFKQLVNAETVTKFKYCLLGELNYLAENQRIFVPRIDPDKFN